MMKSSLRFLGVLILTVLLAVFLHSCGGGGGDGGDGNGASTPKVTVSASDDPIFGLQFSISISDCSWSTSTSEISNIQYNTWGRRTSFNWSVTLNDGNCAGQTYSVFVHDISYGDVSGMFYRAEYDYNGNTYDVQVL